MPTSPRLRRLVADRKALELLKADSSVFDFVARGDMPESYMLIFNGRGIWRPDNGSPVLFADRHEVHLRLGAAYPRMMPELTWRSPIFHPNISASGVVCLGGYGTYWVPSLSLDELCTMLWDMIRYANYDPNSPYNRDAAIWAKQQKEHRFPLDARPIRDLIAHHKRAPAVPKTTATSWKSLTTAAPATPAPAPMAVAPVPTAPVPVATRNPVAATDEIVFLDEDVVEAEVLDDEVASGESEIVFID